MGRTILLLLLICRVAGVHAHDDSDSEKGDLTSGGGGTGGPFEAFNIELLSHLPLSAIGGGTGAVRGSDIWGWTDGETGREYALVGRSNGTAFVDITDPVNPVFVGDLPTFTDNSAWRDIKVYADHAYIVSDSNGAHGMQVFDLTELKTISSPPVVFSETAHYDGFTRAHNLVINEASGYAYAVGTNTDRGGLHIIDLADPAAPAFAGGFSQDGYTHDAQVVTYQGPDVLYQGREIAFSSNEDSLTIVDVTDKSAPLLLSIGTYIGSNYVHQGWLTEDHAFFLSNDELDERNDPNVNYTRTHIWDVSDLDNPMHIGYHEASVQSVDHNLYTHNGLVYEANYTSGLRVLDYADVANTELTEVAYIDTHPAKDSLSSFDGAWSVYPYFSSGSIIIGDREEGLIVVRLISADLAISSSDAPESVLEGKAISVNVLVVNNGPDDASGVTLTSELPAGVGFISAVSSQGSCEEAAGAVNCGLGSLPNGSSATVEIEMRGAVPTTLENTVRLTVTEVDPDQSNNQVILTTTVLGDQDGDGVANTADNCAEIANTDQLDTDRDNIGNLCDCDLNQDDFCGGPDFTLFIGCFNAATNGDATCEAADMNGDGFVGGPDFTLFIGGFNGAPGPSGL